MMDEAKKYYTACIEVAGEYYNPGVMYNRRLEKLSLIYNEFLEEEITLDEMKMKMSLA